jgi:predicted phosphodiesterase
LSDLHFGGSHQFRQTPNDPSSPSLGEAVARALNRYTQEPKFDCVVLSGDFLSNNAPEDSVLAHDMCEELAASLKLKSSKVLCVPGNHDLSWDPKYKQTPFRFYDSLVKDLGAAECVHASLPQVVPVVAPAVGKKGLAVILLDSCYLESEKMAGYGRVGQRHLDEVERKAREAKISSETYILVAVLHHHLLPISPEEKIYDPESPKGDPLYRPSVTTDAVEVLRRLAELGVSLVLHGHQHQPRVLQYRNLSFNQRAIYVVAAGSCGASQTKTKEYFIRNFFVHEIGETAAFAIPFNQSEENQDQFKHGKAFQMSFAQAGADVEEKSAEVMVGGVRASETGFAENSDLVLVLFSVVDCPKARQILRSFFLNFGDTSEFKELQPTYCRLISMYDLLGRWDLAVKFRLDRKVDRSRVVDLLKHALIERGMLSPKAEGTLQNFAQTDSLAIERELPTLDQLNATGEVKIERTWLGKTDEYERKLCQRGFVYIYVTPENRTRLLRDLRAALAMDRKTATVIEAVLVSKEAIVLEIFMNLPQLLDVSRLNRVIEPVLTEFKSQKYTLLCYAYDEEPLG